MTTQEIEHYDDDGTFLGIASDVIEDLLERDVPGSVFLLVILALTFAWGAREVIAIVRHRGGKE